MVSVLVSQSVDVWRVRCDVVLMLTAEGRWRIWHPAAHETMRANTTRQPEKSWEHWHKHTDYHYSTVRTIKRVRNQCWDSARTHSIVSVKTFIMLQNIYILNKCCSFELSIHLWILKNKIYQFPQKYCAAQLFSTLIIIRNVSYYYDFWRSCDTEDCSNDAENTAAHHRNKLQFNTYSHRKQLIYIIIIFHIFTVLLIK